MTEQWADYYISEVRYNTDESFITHLHVHRTCDFFGIRDLGEVTREQVVASLEAKNTFVTVFTDLNSQSNRFTRGENVGIITVNEIKYIRTDNNETACDNLENLPRF